MSVTMKIYEFLRVRPLEAYSTLKGGLHQQILILVVLKVKYIIFGRGGGDFAYTRFLVGGFPKNMDI